MKILKYLIIISTVIIGLSSCSEDRAVKFRKNPVDILIRDMAELPSFVIILHDMDYDESKDKAMHQYQILTNGKDTVESKITQWFPVSDQFFLDNEDNMGMELASKKDGKVNKTVSPAGYSNYIGNEKYGHWQERNGSSFWEFYGKYAFLSSMFRMTMFPVSYGYYHDYRSNYYRTGRPYYGSNGRRTYGTRSSANRNSKWNTRSSAFKNKVRSRTRQSVTNKKRRNASRFNQTRSRSRSRGFGK